MYFPALGRIYRGAWCWRRRCCRAGTWRGWVLPCIVDTVASSAGEPQSLRRPERYAFDLCEELDVESLDCTMYTRALDLFFFALSLPPGLTGASVSLQVSPCIGLPLSATCTGGVLFNSSNRSFHLGSSRRIRQQCMKLNGSFTSNIFIASSI